MSEHEANVVRDHCLAMSELYCNDAPGPMYQRTYEVIVKLQAEVERMRKREESARCPQCDHLRLELGEMRGERDQLKSCEVVMRAALTHIANFTQTENLLWWQAEARAALTQCSTNNPEFQPLDEEGRPQPKSGEPTVPVGHFLRGDRDPFICKNCGEWHSDHIHTDEASRCPPSKLGGSQ